MSLNIAKKLDFLMRLTGTQNNTLGKALSFDASYISLKYTYFLFVDHMKNVYQKEKYLF